MASLEEEPQSLSYERGRSIARVVELDGDGRLLAGEKVGEKALANARELIGQV